jgi:hypothetical protein
MSIETNKLTMHRFTEFINTAREKLATELISPHAIFHVPGRSDPMRGPAGSWATRSAGTVAANRRSIYVEAYFSSGTLL